MGKTDLSKLEALDALIAEKRKHQGFLDKLEGRRASTPDHVYNKLRDEYLVKLTDLQVRAASEAESINVGLEEEELALAEIESKLATIVEERVEGELRAEVGEYEPKDWSKRLESLNASISKIEKERDARAGLLNRTRTLLAEATGTPVGTPSAPAAAAKPAVAPARATPADTKPIKESSSAPAPAPRASGAVKAPAPEPVKAEERPSAPAPAKSAPITTGTSFDELAFLNSVVGRVSTPVRVDPPAPVPRSSRPVSEIKEPPSGPSAVPAATAPATPVAPPAPAATDGTAAAAAKSAARSTKSQPESDEPPSALGRPTPRTSQAVKTLKCQECGTLNYPTEWYCERCGGELAAL